MHDIHKNIEEYNPNEKSKILIVFDDTIADMLSNKELNPTVTELFIRARKLNISLAFIKQSCFPAPKNIRLNSTPYFIMEIPNKQELQQIAFNHSSGIDIRDFMNLYRECTDVQKVVVLFSYWSYSFIRWSFTFHKKSFRKNITTNHDNWWQD